MKSHFNRDLLLQSCLRTSQSSTVPRLLKLRVIRRYQSTRSWRLVWKKWQRSGIRCWVLPSALSRHSTLDCWLVQSNKVGFQFAHLQSWIVAFAKENWISCIIATVVVIDLGRIQILLLLSGIIDNFRTSVQHRSTCLRLIFILSSVIQRIIFTDTQTHAWWQNSFISVHHGKPWICYWLLYCVMLAAVVCIIIIYTVSQKNVTTFSTITLTISVRLQQFLA